MPPAAPGLARTASGAELIVLEPGQMAEITAAAEAAYPEECCGLLIGSGSGPPEPGYRVARVAVSENKAPDRREARFEVDPALRLTLQRRLRGGPDRVIGLFHSHPDGAAEPSPRDLDSAWEPELVWLIVAVSAGKVTRAAAHVLVNNNTRFDEIPLVVSEAEAGAAGDAGPQNA